MKGSAPLSALSPMAFIVTFLLLLNQFVSIPCFDRRLGVAASTTDENSNFVCSADDRGQDCTDPTSFAKDSNTDPRDVEEPECADENPECRYWASAGECQNNPSYMLEHCKLSCESCNNGKYIIDSPSGQLIPKYHRKEEVEHIISQTAIYMKQIATEDKYKDIIHECKNIDQHCSEWALDGGCDDNPTYMKDKCAPACQTCDHMLELKEKCALSPDSSLDAIKPGGMDQLFENMIHAAKSMGLDPKVWSRPMKKHDNYNDSENAAMSCENDITNQCDLQDGPWVITLENFVSDEEISHLMTWGRTMKYERSQAGDEITQSRTSAHSWCADECYEDKTVALIRKRIVDITSIPEDNYEALQLLKYEVGQYYWAHNDFIEYHNEQAHGPRLLTFFIYFNEVEEGGETRFPRLDLTIHPKKGRVLVWPSIQDDKIWSLEERTNHEAMEVKKGQKFAANAWIHMRDFQTPYSLGCPG